MSHGFFRRLFGRRAPSSVLSIELLCEGVDVPPEVLRFEHAAGGRVLFGEGVLDQLGEEASSLGKRALLVTDPGIRKAGHIDRAERVLQKAGLVVAPFDDVRENPTTLDVERAVEAARHHDADLIVGLGGGSSMDTAKGCNFILTNGGHMRDYWGVGKATSPMLPFIAIPTTAGTGSECQSFALIADEETHMKMACGDGKAAAKVAILDPELTLTQPARVTACTGIDAIAHAVETAVCTKRSSISSAYSRMAFRLLEQGFERVLKAPDDLRARAQMQLGAAFAGTAIEASMLGAAHSLANPLTAKYGTIHGQAVGVMLPHVVRANRKLPEVSAIYDELHSGLESRLEELLKASQLGSPLKELGVEVDCLDELAGKAKEQWTAQFNPVSFSIPEFRELYEAAL
ncbi:MAG: iron-containing alcohol dehydrogenase [Verrucomicrobiota bacterium]